MTENENNCTMFVMINIRLI
uniref:Uncharacterized protein n=1 Tax=Arundo donax TaxID=35708 RepID=A0A0A9C4L2_ARUDO